MDRYRLLLRGLWFRRGLATAVLVVAALTVAAAALGPMYARAASESILQDHLTEAGWRSGLQFTDLTDDASQPDALKTAAQQLPRPGAIHGYDSQILGILTTDPALIESGPDEKVVANLSWRAGFCSHLTVVSGRCPTGPGQVMVSSRYTAAGLDWKVGTRLDAGGMLVVVVGFYDLKNVADNYWFGHNYLDAAADSDNSPPQIDTLFVAENGFQDQPEVPPTRITADYPLVSHELRLSGIPRIKHVVNGFETKYPAFATSIVFATELPAVLHSAAKERSLLEVGTTLVTLQLALLAWLVLYQVVADAIEARGNEIAMAKLRGYEPLATVRFGLGETLALLAASVPIGLVVAMVATRIFTAAVLIPGVPVVLPWAAVGAAMIAFVGGTVAILLAGRRTLTRSVLEQWRRTTHVARRSKLTIAVDVVVAAGALAGFVALRLHSSKQADGNTGALVAPALLVLAVALLGVRLLPLVSQALARATRRSRRIGVFLAGRQVARRQSGLRLAALLAVAVGLATFAIAGESVTAPNRAARAHTEFGAAQVARIVVSPDVDPIAATHRADPGGKWAMAAATWLPNGGDSVTGTVLALDASREARVGYDVPHGPSAADISRLVATPVAAPLTLTGDAVRVRVTASDLNPGVTAVVQVDVRSQRKGPAQVEMQPLRAGANTYEGTLPCADGCQFTGITWDRPIAATTAQHGTVALTGLQVRTGGTWKDMNLQLGNAKAWRAAPAAGIAADHVAVTDTAITDRFTNDLGGYGGLLYQTTPYPMPAIATPSSYVRGQYAPSPLAMTDNSGNTAYFAVKRTTAVLPSVLTGGLIVDLDALRTQVGSFTDEATWFVWIGKNAPSDAVARLRATGLQVQDVTQVKHRIALLARQGPALSLLLLLMCAITGAALAVAGTAISVSASSRRRSFELAALRAIGVRNPALIRSGMLEQLLLSGTAVVLGVPAGWLAARLAMPVIPEFADPTPVQLDFVPHPGTTGLFVVAFVALMIVTAYAAAVTLVRLAVPTRLREAE